MKKYIIIGCSGLLILVIGLILVYESEELLSIDKSTQNDIMKEIENIEAQEATINKWVNAEDIEGNFVEHPNEEVLARYKEKKGVVEFLFATVLMENTELFVQAFDTETISKDLFKDDEPNKELVAKRLMSRISRDDTLSEVKYTPLTGAFGTEEDESKVTLYYEDGRKVSMMLSFVKGGTAHSDDDEIYSVKTSAWDMINNIEKAH